MKVLLLSFHFPPDAPLAATRAPKLARHLLNSGYDLRVLCADDPQGHQAHQLTIDPGRVIRTPWRDLREIPSNWAEKLNFGSSQQQSAAAQPISTPPAPKSTGLSLRNKLAKAYDAVICRPDQRMGWGAPAVEAARELFETWKPDLIYATCPPHSTAVIAEKIARLGDIPFIAEFRDRWGHNAYSDYPIWRQKLDALHERSVLSKAAAIVTVSPLWAAEYAQRYGDDRVVLSMNGYDPDEYPLDPPTTQPTDPETLHLLHAGAFYPNRRDPRTLFAGIAALGDNAKHVHVTLLGKDVEPAIAMAKEAGISNQLTLLPPEPHRDIIQRQYAADALLLLQWNDARDAGTIPGKLFECIGARRPIICTGYTRGVTAGIVRGLNLGIVSNEPKVIANELSRLLTRKRTNGSIAPLDKSVRRGMSCPEQFAALDPLFQQVTGLSPLRIAAE